MDIITYPQNTTIELSPAARWLANGGALSALSPDVAINRPLGELVLATLTAAAGESENTARAYQTALGLFLQFLGVSLGEFFRCCVFVGEVELGEGDGQGWPE